MAEFLYRLGQFSARRAWQVIISWLVVVALAGTAYFFGAGTLSTSFDIPDTPSSQVVDELSERLPDFAGASGTVVFHTEDGTAFTSEQREEISRVVESAADIEYLTEVVDPFTTETDREESAATLADAAKEIKKARKQLDDGQKQLNAGRAELDAAQAQLTAGLELAAQYGVDASQLAAGQAQIDAGRAEIDKQQKVIDEGRAELEANALTVEQGKQLQSYSDGIRMVSADESAALSQIVFTQTRLELTPEAQEAVVDHFTATDIDGVNVDFSSDIVQGIPKILGVGEAVGVGIAAVVLLIMLGSALAASLPIVTALVGVGVGVLTTLSFSGMVEMASVTPILGVMLGLAVGIDYSLFIVNRHRKQLLQGSEVFESIGLANGTAGNAVVFAGSTVVIALVALNVTGISFLGLMGTAAAVCVAVAVLIAITLTPALLGLAGDRIFNKKSRGQVLNARESGMAVDMSLVGKKNAIAKPMPTWRAIVTSIVAIGVLLVLAIPTLSMRLGLPDGSGEPEDSTAFAAYDVTLDGFGEGANGPVLVAANLVKPVTDDNLVETQAFIASKIARLDAVTAVAPIGVSDDKKLIAFQIVPIEGPNSESTAQLVHNLRDMSRISTNIELGVAGQAAMNIDISESLQDVLPTYLAVVIGLSLFILIVVFRSFLVPLIATGGFVLSLLASFGAVVAVFQWGWFADVLGISPGPLLSFFPVILVGILFGLAMDYQLFLATGMREAYVHGSSARLAVVQGLRTGRSVVIAAALIMVAVFGGFIFAEDSIVRLMGFGLAFGVFIDAFVVRLLLMPALMHLHGEAAWWFPGWLERILPDIDVEGAALERRHPLH